MLLSRILIFSFVLSFNLSFGQGFAGEDSEWIFNSEPNGIIQIDYEKDTIINDEIFGKYLKTITRLIDQDTVRFEIGSIYLTDNNGIVKYSNDGFYIDTLFNFIAEPGDKWKIYEDSTLVDSIEIEVLDIFSSTINNVEIKTQSLLYKRIVGGNERTFVDTIYEFIGAKYLYLDPFDVEEGSPEGGVLRCFTNEILGNVQLDNRFTLGVDLYSMFDYECKKTTSLNFNDEFEISFYPNPSHSVLNIELPFPLKSNIQIIDIAGNVHLENNISESASIDISHLTNGMYFLLINRTDTFKFFKLE